MKEIGNRTEIKLKTVNDVVFHVQCFDPFTALRVLGDLQRVLSPIVGSMVGSANATDVESINILSKSIGNICKGLHEYVDGDTLVKLIEMLVREDYISVSIEGGTPKRLSKDLVNLVFNGNPGGVLELAYEVVKVNYGGFFTIFKTLFGGQEA